MTINGQKIPWPLPSLTTDYVLLSFVGGQSFSSGVIQLFTAGEVSHVDAIEPGTGLLWGARFDRVGGQPSGYYPRPEGYLRSQSRRVIMAVACRPSQAQLFWKLARSSKGEPYDWLGIAGFASGRDWHLRGTAFCSEKKTQLMESAGIFKLAARPNKVSPQMLMVAASARTDTRIVYSQGVKLH